MEAARTTAGWRGLAGATWLAASIAQAAPPAFECAPLQPHPDSARAYARVAGQARCEGYLDHRQLPPRQPVELVSLVAEPSPERAGLSATIELAARSRLPLRVVVQPMNWLSPAYRLDALLLPNRMLRWDARRVLTVPSHDASDHGFLALLPGTEVLAAAPLRWGTAGGLGGVAQATLRVSAPMMSIAWRAWPAGGAATARWHEVPPESLSWRVTLPIELPADGRGLRVEVRATSADSAEALPLLRFSILGAFDEAPVVD